MHVKMTMQGESGAHELDNSANNFERGKADTFKLKMVDLGGCTFAVSGAWVGASTFENAHVPHGSLNCVRPAQSLPVPPCHPPRVLHPTHPRRAHGAGGVARQQRAGPRLAP